MQNEAYTRHLAEKFIRKYELNLDSLTVLTEAASGAYLCNALIACLAGADEVMLYAKDSRFGAAKEIKEELEFIFASNKVTNYEFIENLSGDRIARADIVTNSGHLRPFGPDFIHAMKPAAVLPLMWEPWEIRPGEIDFAAAREKGILILGTNEHAPPCDTKLYNGLLALKLMLDQGVSIVQDKILVIGDQDMLAGAIVQVLKEMGIESEKISPDSPSQTVKTSLEGKTYVIVADHIYAGCIIGDDAIISAHDLKDTDIHAVGVIAGWVDKDRLMENGISVYPDKISPPGYLSYNGYELGPSLVMDLFAAGLKVGEISARARKNGMSLAEAARHTIANAPALDLTGEHSWMKI